MIILVLQFDGRNMPFTIVFPYQFFDLERLAAHRSLPHFDTERRACIVPPVELTESVRQEMLDHFADINEQLESSGSVTDGVYCLDGFKMISIKIVPDIQAIELTFEGEDDRELLDECLSLDEWFGCGQFLASDKVLIMFHENQHSKWGIRY